VTVGVRASVSIALLVLLMGRPACDARSTLGSVEKGARCTVSYSPSGLLPGDPALIVDECDWFYDRLFSVFAGTTEFPEKLNPHIYLYDSILHFRSETGRDNPSFYPASSAIQTYFDQRSLEAHERWRKEYNTIRPHSSLGYRPPAPEAILPFSPGSAPLHPAKTAFALT